MKAHLIALALLALQAVPTGRLSIEGQAVVLDTGAPVPHARILVARLGGTVEDYRTAVASADGRFTVAGLTAGSYRVYADRPGYLRGEYGRRTAGVPGLPVSLLPGQAAAPIVVAMIPTGVIAGRVLEEGRPVRNVLVRAMRVSYVNGERSLEIAKYVRSDDLGEYRLFDLPPGQYYVSTLDSFRPRIEGGAYVVPEIPSNANGNRRETRTPAADALQHGLLHPDALEPTVDVPLFYPGTTDPTSASAIHVRPGGTVRGIDVSVARVRAFRIRGRVMDSTTGGPAAGIVNALADQVQGTVVAPPTAPIISGDFELAGVPPGRYALVARTTTEPRLYGTASIEVTDGDVAGVSILVRPGTPLRGRVTVDGGRGDISQVTSLQLNGVNGFGYSVLSAPGGTGDRRLQPDGTFFVDNVEPREYRVQVRGPGSRIIPARSIRFGMVDVTDRPLRVGADAAALVLEIDVSLATGRLEVTTVDERRRPVPGVTIALVPDPPRRHHSSLYRTFTTDAFGRIQAGDVVPGEYRLFVSDVDPSSWQDPDVVRQYEALGEPVRVRTGGTASASVRVGR